MASAAALRDELLCSICLSTYTDPVMLRCGHNFCRVCIHRVLDTQDQSGVYSCPQCREKFRERPTLMRCLALRNIIENFLIAPPTQTETGIFCTYCVDSPEPAAKSCLHCEASLWQKKKEKLKHVLQSLIIRKKETEEKVQILEEQRKKTQEEAVGEAERVTSLCTNIRRQLDHLEKRVLIEISRQEEQKSLSLSALIQKLEIQKEKLSRKMRHIEELCNMTDPLTVLQEPDTGDLYDPEEDGGDGDTRGHDIPIHNVDGLDLAEISYTLHTLCNIVTGISRGIYVEGPADILLDVNTAGNYIHISDDLKTATWTQENQNRPETAERFQCKQVMSRRGFSSGQHYWDVEIRRSGELGVGMCYPSIDMRGHQSYIGNNSKSWCLWRYNNQYLVMHDSKVIRLPDNISSNRFRICLDYEAGRLSFFELCDPIRHLHTFTATFTEPLHTALWVNYGCLTIKKN